ncbi:unnamed protein product [Prunus armeniaca]|uniref:Uncharacterized protein n=1 Tax=Prunus armeniaca TaxID=36596 RepID=A0A6J5U853_PRUAR|nr:unnamed protein product [Prunus armeniaca]
MLYYGQSPERKEKESCGCSCGSESRPSRPSSPCCSRTARAPGSENGCGSDSDSGSGSGSGNDRESKSGSGGDKGSGGGDIGKGGGGRPSSPDIVRASTSIFFFGRDSKASASI